MSDESVRLQMNDKGEVISGIKKLRDDKYGTGGMDSDGQPVVNWSLLEYADEHGFDIRHLEANGSYKIEVELPYGTILIRYGNETGRFTAPQFTRYEDLSLPYLKDTVEYNEYKVTAEKIRLICKVIKGRVAPGFGSPGGAIQYLHPMTIRKSLQKGILERIS
ncbi:MAG: TNT domain-containing protein [Lachnospiraceae bacterium]|nr:TNT domain-containing protein [Lachnospiraceae bacterium]